MPEFIRINAVLVPAGNAVHALSNNITQGMTYFHLIPGVMQRSTHSSNQTMPLFNPGEQHSTRVTAAGRLVKHHRSEERRVGKEGRARRAPSQERKRDEQERDGEHTTTA